MENEEFWLQVGKLWWREEEKEEEGEDSLVSGWREEWLEAAHEAVICG